MTAEAYYEESTAQIKEGAFTAALELLEKGLEDFPDDALLWANKGRAHRGLKDLDEALGAYHQALSHDDDSAIAWNGYGNVLFDQQDIERAKEAYRTAIKLDRNYGPPWFGLGILQASTQQSGGQNPAPYFQRAEYISGGEHATNLFILFSQLPGYSFFSYRVIQDYMTAEQMPEWKDFVQRIDQEAGPLKHFVQQLATTEDRGGMNEGQWHLWLGLLNYYMGDPTIALHHLTQSQEQGSGLDLRIAYYQAQACWDFLESDRKYTEPALEKAATYLPTTTTGWKIWKKEEKAPALSGEDLIQCYYAGMLYIDNDEIKNALRCFERIEEDYLPAAYQAFWCYEELKLAAKKKAKADFILEQEAKQRQFVDGISPQELDLQSTTVFTDFLSVLQYVELIDAIELLHYHAEFEGNPHDFEVVNAKEQPAFAALWRYEHGTPLYAGDEDSEE